MTTNQLSEASDEARMTRDIGAISGGKDSVAMAVLLKERELYT